MAQWIAGITRGHNGGVCLLRDGEIVFAIEEERLSRMKYEGTPLLSLQKIKEYTDHLDFLVVAHTIPLALLPETDYSMYNVYVHWAIKLGLLEDTRSRDPHPQVIDLSHIHHKLHAACAFYRSGFEDATAVIIDGAGTWKEITADIKDRPRSVFEVESIFSCSYPNRISTRYKHMSGTGPWIDSWYPGFVDNDTQEVFDLFVSNSGGITKSYESVTKYCGWIELEAGKTMGLSPYGKKVDDLPPIYVQSAQSKSWVGNRNLIVTNFPQGGEVNEGAHPSLFTEFQSDIGLEDLYPTRTIDLSRYENRRNLAYAVQEQSQAAALDLILRAVEITGVPRVVLSGGYALNCVANYHYLNALREKGIDFYVEPVSSDAGTAVGAAMIIHREMTKDMSVKKRADHLYLGPEYTHSADEILATASKYKAKVTVGVTNEQVIDLIRQPNIVAIFQGRSENGPRALGNRSILFDPTVADGKDHVNRVKRREYFRPFAGSILAEHAHEWFDMRGLAESPTMMYAVNCQPGVEAKIPSIIHVDGTCRIQTVTREQNPHYYDLIKEFHDQTGVPVIFNTSFNLGGEPLVETLDDAVRTLANSEIEYLYLPEYQTLITLKNQGEASV